MTLNHNYNIPDEGRTNWHVPLNENFRRIDTDVEIRDQEGNRDQYEPKDGAKFFAIDSGITYIGDGETWQKVSNSGEDSTFNSVETSQFSTGELLKAGQSSTAIVAPSVSSAFNTIQEAIDAGFDDIILAEQITENNIEIKRDGMRFRGYGGGSYQTINDPEDGDPVFHIGQERKRGITMANLNVSGGSNSGPVIDTRNPDDTGAALWEIYNCQFSAGPIILGGPRNQLRHVTCDSQHTSEYGLNDYKTGAALIMGGATCGIVGGSYSNKEAATEACYFSGAAGSITGGVTFTNAGPDISGYDQRDILFAGCARMLIGPSSYESSKKYDMQFGVNDTNVHMNGLNHSTIIAPSMKYGSIKLQGGNSHNVSILNPLRSIQIDQDGARGSMLIISINDVSVTGNSPQDVTHFSFGKSIGLGGSSNSPPTQTKVQTHNSKPSNPEKTGMVIADGTNWDPDGDGKAEMVIYNGTEWLEVVDLKTSL